MNANEASHLEQQIRGLEEHKKALQAKLDAGRRTCQHKWGDVVYDPIVTKGYQYEGAETSFEIIVRKVLGKYQPLFELTEFKVIVNEPSINNVNSYALIKIKVGDQEEITASDGDGPVNALDNALRKALERFYPNIKSVKLTDYKVRVLDSKTATASKVRVLIESTDGEDTWTTIGVSTDIIEASWRALVESIEYKVIKDGEKEVKV